MPINVIGYAASAAKEALRPFRFERRDPRPDDVLIDVLYCGVCHTDLHYVQNDWGLASYPLVPGHEIVGRVARAGPKARRFKAGDIAAVGCLVDSCRRCAACKKGLEQYCERTPTFTYAAVDRRDQRPTYGGYSRQIVVSDRFVLKVPKGLDLKGAAPLLCAGITTWSPLRRWKVGKGSSVAVVGLGGLGHMALKLARGLGADVTLFTRTAGKEADARRLGARDVVLTRDPAAVAALSRRFDLIIDTVPYAHDLNPYVPTLAVDGTLALVGYLGGLTPELDTVPLIMGRRSVAGSVIGGLPETQEVLDFCAKKGIAADVEVIKIQDINAAYDRLRRGDVKYRFVIDMASLEGPAAGTA